MKLIVRFAFACTSLATAGLVYAQTDPIDEQQLYASMRAQMERACPAVWEELASSMDTSELTEVPWNSNAADRDEFVSLLGEILPAESEENLQVMADDLATVATECASHRVALLDALISKTPREVLLAMDSVNRGLNKSIEYLDCGWSVGAVRITGRLEAQDGWVFLIGQSVGNESVAVDSRGEDYSLRGEEYADLFELAKNWSPNSVSASWENGDQVLLPDLRGRAIIAPDNMGGDSANVVTNPGALQLGGVLGSQKRVLTAAQLPTHSHTIAGGGAHSHTVGTDTHSHKVLSSVYEGSGSPQSTYPYFEGKARPNYQNTIQSAVQSDSHNHSLSPAPDHTHTVNNAGSSAEVGFMQPSIVFNVEMKY